LSESNLRKYVEAKYGSDDANVFATHHYKISNDDDTIVDPTQVTNVPVPSSNLKFSSDVSTLFTFAANGRSTIFLSEPEKSFVNYLRTETTSPLPYPLYRGDITPHSVASQISSADSLDMLRFEVGSTSLLVEKPDHITYYIIKDLVETGNATLINNYLIESATPVNNLYASYSYVSDSNLYYFPKIGTLSSNSLSQAILSVSASSNVTGLYGFLREYVQTYYLKGDITGSTYLSGNVNIANTDANISYLSFTNNMTDSHIHWGNLQALLTDISTNSTISGFVSPIYEQGETTPYANAVEVTNMDYEIEQNEKKRRIKVLRKEYLPSFIAEFEKKING